MALTMRIKRTLAGEEARRTFSHSEGDALRPQTVQMRDFLTNQPNSRPQSGTTSPWLRAIAQSIKVRPGSARVGYRQRQHHQGCPTYLAFQRVDALRRQTVQMREFLTNQPNSRPPERHRLALAVGHSAKHKSPAGQR